MGKARNLTGRVFGRWTVKELTAKRNSSGNRYWLCECSCEAKTVRAVSAALLMSGKSSSCGCKHIENLKLKPLNSGNIKDRTGEKNVSNQGYSLEIVAYRHAHDIDVLVDNKYTVITRYDNFKLGAVDNPNHSQRRVGAVAISNQGYSLEIVAYRSHKDIDVLVAKQHINKGVTYAAFIRGQVGNPAVVAARQARLGEVCVSNQGYDLEIVAYRTYKSIDVLVDSTYLVVNTTYGEFKNGSIRNPEHGKRHIGEKCTNYQGYELELVAYRRFNDIDVLIDGKHLRTGVSYDSFRDGTLRNFNYVDDRIGATNVSVEGYTLEIVAYRAWDDVDVLLDSKYVVEKVRYSHFMSGCISNPYHPTRYGVGYLGVGTPTKINKKLRPCYMSWSGALMRCYDASYLKKRPTYADCTMYEGWHNFQVFSEWFDANFYTVDTGERMELDKDILVKGNKLYGPDTCIYVPQSINGIFAKKGCSKSTGLPVGVMSAKNSKYTASVARWGKGQKHLGTFDTPEEAFQAYKTAKEAYIKQVADEYKDRIPQKLYDALYAYTIDIND